MTITRYYPQSNHTYIHHKCNDCGCELTESNTNASSMGICNTCWENRGWVIANATKIGQPKLQEIQAAMRGKTHRAKKLIDAIKIEGE